MTLSRALIGGILLFLGRELNFLFAGAMAALLSFRLAAVLPPRWPNWTDYAIILALTVLAAAIPIINSRVGYAVSGFLAGAYFLVEYTAPGMSGLPLLAFLSGGVIGALIIGIFTEWALIVVSCLFGAYYVTKAFVLAPMTEMLVGSGLFIIGALTQAVIKRMQINE